MKHAFNIELASKYGVTESLILEDIGFWLKINKKNNNNLYDGFTWVYNTIAEFKERLVYLSDSKISRALSKLEKLGVIKTGNYNKHKYDRTKWYTIVDEGVKALFFNNEIKCEMDNAKVSDSNSQVEETIPDTKTDTKTNNNIYPNEKLFNKLNEIAYNKITIKEFNTEYKEHGHEVIKNTINLLQSKKPKYITLLFFQQNIDNSKLYNKSDVKTTVRGVKKCGDILANMNNKNEELSEMRDVIPTKSEWLKSIGKTFEQLDKVQKFIYKTMRDDI